MKLTLAEIEALYSELNGRVINEETGERSKGVLAQKLSIRAKHILNNDLNKKVAEVVKELDESRVGIFKEMIEAGKGEERDGRYVIPKEYQEEVIEKINELMSIEKSVEVPKINVAELYNIETEDYWPVLLDKLLAKKEEPKSEAPVVPLADEK
jgi:hypothetical protein